MGSYLIIYVLNVVMLAGNHALPMTLRFFIWAGTKIWRKGEINETLHFLLDHPRRSVTTTIKIWHAWGPLTSTGASYTYSPVIKHGSSSFC